MAQDDFVEILRALNLVSCGSLVGIVLSEAFIILPLVRSLPLAEGVTALRFAGARAWRLAPACGATAWLSGIAVAALLPWRDPNSSAILTLAGDVLMGAAVLVTYGPYVAVDKWIRGLHASDAPTEAPARFHRLARLHALRTAFYTFAFVCFTTAALTD